jgi:3-deoxy-7-phosphoheptulonate synthase / chorismate mutase
MKKDKTGKEIKDIRAKIDRLDDSILEKVNDRNKFAKKILSIKKSLNITAYDPARENEIIERLADAYSGELDRGFIRNLYRSIFDNTLVNYESSPSERAMALQNVLDEKPFMIAGPCAVESREQIFRLASVLSAMGIRLLRGGAFKPRTSPNSFQGMGVEGLKYMREAADKYNMFVVSELLEAEQLDQCYDLIDIIQIGSRSMNSTGLLKRVGRMSSTGKKPVLLKRGFSSTIHEFLLASEYIRQEGNENIILCLRGIRTFEQIDSSFRYTPDLAGIIELKEMTGMPVLFDPSHSAGNSKYVVPMAKAALNLGADGLIIEVHDMPEMALSDKEQSIVSEDLKIIIEHINK